MVHQTWYLVLVFGVSYLSLRLLGRRDCGVRQSSARETLGANRLSLRERQGSGDLRHGDGARSQQGVQHLDGRRAGTSEEDQGPQDATLAPTGWATQDG